MKNFVGLVILVFCTGCVRSECTERDRLLFFKNCSDGSKENFSFFANTALSEIPTLLKENAASETAEKCIAHCNRKSNCLAVDVNKTSNGVICRYSDIQPTHSVDVLCGEGLFYIKGDVSSLVEVTLQMPNFTLNFDDNVTNFDNVNVQIGPDSGFLGFGADLTGVYDFIQLDETVTNQCPLMTYLCAGRATTHAFWAKILTEYGYNHLMANNIMRFRANSGTIQYFQWYFPDGSNRQRYAFTMFNFDKYDQWVHLVMTFKPDGTDDALHFYMNGREMNIDVEVHPMQSGTRIVNRLVFGVDNDEVNDARWYFDEFYAWDLVLTPREVSALYNSFPQA